MKKTKFLFYGLIPLCVVLTGCPEPYPLPDPDPGTENWSSKYQVQFNTIKLTLDNHHYSAINKVFGYWENALYANSEITNFRGIFSEEQKFDLTNSEIRATSKSARDSKSVSYTKLMDGKCGSDYFNVWVDVSNDDNFMSQELNIDIYSGPYKSDNGQQGNLYWNKKMFANAYSQSDIIWKDDLKEEAILTAGKFQSVAAFKLISSSSGSTGGSGGGGSISGGLSGGGSNPYLPDGMTTALDKNNNLYTLDNNNYYIANNTNLYLKDNTSSVLIDAHYRTDVAASASVAAAQEGVLLVYSRATANTQILQ